MKLGFVITVAIVVLAANAVRLAVSSSPVISSPTRAAEKVADARTQGRELHTSDLPRLIENLKNAGFPDRMVRALITAEIDHQFRRREDALRPATPLPYWEMNPVPEPLQTRLARIDLRREKARLRAQLLGTEPNPPDDTTPVAPEKREQLRMITEDYGALIADARGRSGAGALESEKKEIEFLESERQRELAALLTPDELASYDLILSGAVADLRRELRYFDASDSELAVIGTALKEKRKAATPGGRIYAEQRALEETAQVRRDNTIKEAIGEARFAEYLKSRDADYRLVRDFAGRAGMPPEVADQVYDLRATVFARAIQIGDSPGLDVAARKDALKQLVENTRGQVRAIVGPEASVAVVKQIDTTWLRHLEDGNLPSMRDGGTTRLRSLLLPAPPP